SLCSRLRRPTRPTLFPYTRSSDLRNRTNRGEPAGWRCRRRQRQGCRGQGEQGVTGMEWLDNSFYATLALVIFLGMTIYFGIHKRSEEHTSELQSRENLVCRLLLEK